MLTITLGCHNIRTRMKITHVCSELSPLACTGGLGEAVAGLTKSLARQGYSIEVILPHYRLLNLNSSHLITDRQLNFVFRSNIGGIETDIEVKKFIYHNDIKLTLLKFPENLPVFDRDRIYGYDDDVERFLIFSSATKEYLIQSGLPDIVHLHDWHTASLAAFLKEMNCKTIFTIHNFNYTGPCDTKILKRFGIYNTSDCNFQDNNSSISLLNTGLVCADRITTVSPTYAKDILSTIKESNLIKVSDKNILGITNGIDFEYWNPQTDPFIKTRYSLKCLNIEDNFFKAKQTNREQLSKKLGLTSSSKPLFGIVTRLTEQKGLSFIKEALFKTLEYGCQMVLMGSCSDSETENIFRDLKQKLETTGQISIELSYDIALSHLIYAASDIFLMPSLFEPCGLAQLIAMRYGTVPIVNKTGGLIDTVEADVNGFIFEHSHGDFINSLKKAVHLRTTHPDSWKRLVREGMSRGSDWKIPAQQYSKLYGTLM